MGQIVKTAGRERDKGIENKREWEAELNGAVRSTFAPHSSFLTFKDYSSV